jgi:quercetin dioxygenase-like cupin family protein
MMNILKRTGLHTLGAAAIFLGLGTVQAGDLNPSAIDIKTADQIPWKKGAANDQAVLYGDPEKPGWYIELYRWHPGNMSRPHFHPNDRFITVLSGTWWVNTGPKYDPSTAVPVHAGSFVKHFAKQIHYDGAKDEEAVIEVVGMGPATVTPAEQK